MKIRSLLLLFTIAITLFSAAYFVFAGVDAYSRLREEMVEKQIKNRGIKDANVLSAMRTVERHRFVPKSRRLFAYADSALPIGEDQTISQPYIVALMTEALRLKKGDKVLEVGTGSGYQAAILGEFVDQVYTIEIICSLANRSEKLLQELGYSNIHVKCGDGYLGWPDQASFDAIIVTCAIDEVPGPLIEQLAEGGRLVIPLGPQGYQNLTLIEKKDNQITRSFITGCRFVPMTGDNVVQ
ncbi:protein-L-isoaspartate(D-aspartate) O-methyltransferase [Candidatus Omnitrophota bacterium]